MHFKKVLCLLVLTVFFFSGKCQKFVFELEPGLKFAGLSLQQNTAQINGSGLGIYEFYQNNTVNNYRQSNASNKLGLEPYLNLNFLEINNKWNLGMGLSTYTSRSLIYISCKGQSYLPYLDKEEYTEHISKRLNTRWQQFYIYATRDFPKFNQHSRFLQNSLTIGFGINKPSVFNPENQIEFYQSYLNNQLGYQKNIIYEKMNFWGSNAPFISFKYEFRFYKKQPFDISITYIQGFSTQYTFQLSAQATDGSAILAQSLNKGSGIRIGVSKPFQIKSK